MGKGNKNLKDLAILDGLDEDTAAFESESFPDVVSAVTAPASGPVQIKYVCIDRGENTAPPLQRVGAGYVLHNTKFTKLPAGKSAVVHTGIQIHIPKGYQGRITILNRQARDLILVGGGIVDANFTNEITVVLMNLGPKDRLVNEGNVVGLLNIEKVPDVELVQVPSLKTTFNQVNKGTFDMDGLSGGRFGGSSSTSNQAMLGGIVSQRNK